MRFLLRVIAMMVAMYAALSVLRRLLLAFTPAAPQVGPRATEAGHLVKDPVCGMTVVPERAAAQAPAVLPAQAPTKHEPIVVVSAPPSAAEAEAVQKDEPVMAIEYVRETPDGRPKTSNRD